jgi:hypothetical protein
MMCPLCNVEHESVQAMGTTVIGCPKLGNNEMVMIRTKMTEKMRADYERAAVALENNEDLPDGETPEWHNVAIDAWLVFFDKALKGLVRLDEVGNRAARLLRDCLDKGETMPIRFTHSTMSIGNETCA